MRSLVARLRRRDALRGFARRMLGREEPAPAVPPAARTRPDGAVTIGDLWAVRAAIAPDGRPRLVNHWATWCDGCVEELPALVAAHAKYRDRIDFVGVSWEAFSLHDSVQSAARAVESGCREFGIAWPNVVFDGTAEALISGLELADGQIPQTTLYAADGRVLFHHLGPVGASELLVLER